MSWQIPWHAVFFPGMIIHEFAHYLACILVGVKVYKVKLWGKEEAYVRHAMPSAWKAIVITVAPFLLCNWLALEVLRTANSLLYNSSWISLIYYWFALSLLYFCFPSDADAKNALEGFVSFYKTKIFKEGNLISRFLWLITFPLLFIPLVILLGIIILFDSMLSLRIVWILTVLVFSISPNFLIPGLLIINNILLRIAQIFI